MEQEKVYTVIGLMSGTSTDGVDAALLRTDGITTAEALGFISIPYDDALRAKIKAQFGKFERDADIEAVEEEITLKHIEAVNALIEETGIEDVDLIGFHGQSISHDPEHGKTVQIGDAALLSDETGIDVVYDFRSADVAAGGEGAPFLPLYHCAIARNTGTQMPCAFLNIGGVSNVTYVGEAENDILAFDCGPGNALIDDVMQACFSKSFDQNGEVAAKGQVNELVLAQLLSDDYFKKQPPKSLDRNPWDLTPLDTLSAEDKVATLTEFTVQAVVQAQSYFKAVPKTWYVCGGGRHNRYMMDRLKQELNGGVVSIDVLNKNGDSLEAEGFAYLAVRSLKNLPLSLPTTTGVRSPQHGGKVKKAA